MSNLSFNVYRKNLEEVYKLNSYPGIVKRIVNYLTILIAISGITVLNFCITKLSKNDLKSKVNFVYISASMLKKTIKET